MTTSLQQEIGRTEQALSALLRENILGDTSLDTNDEWVAVNVIDRKAPRDLDEWRRALVEMLTASEARVDAVTFRLVDDGIVERGDATLRLHDDARAELERARDAISEVTAEIERVTSAADRTAAVRVLGAVRDVVQRRRGSAAIAGE